MYTLLIRYGDAVALHVWKGLACVPVGCWSYTVCNQLWLQLIVNYGFHGHYEPRVDASGRNMLADMI